MADIIAPMKNREQHRSKPFFPSAVAATTPPRVRLGVVKTGSNVIAFFPDFIVRIRCVFAVVR